MPALLLIAVLLLLALWQGLGGWDQRRPQDAPTPPPGAGAPAAPPPRRPVREAPIAGPIDRIVIDKSDRRMLAMQGGRAVRSYDVALGFAPEGDKARQGDGRTPEGVFRIDRRNDRSRFHLSLGLDYPRPEDRARAKAAGVPPGGDIFIHGQPNGRVKPGWRIVGDWTEGCIAVSDAEMDELFPAVALGTPVEIRP